MKIAPSETQHGRRRGRSEAIILFSISGQMFAISANEIHEVRSTDSISAAAIEVSVQEIPKVRHLLRRGKSILFVVNGCKHFGLPASRAEHAVILRNSCVALLVETIERMGTMSLLMALPAGFTGPERAWYRGITLISGNVVPVIRSSGFLDEHELAQLESIAAQNEINAPSLPELRDAAISEQPQ